MSFLPSSITAFAQHSAQHITSTPTAIQQLQNLHLPLYAAHYTATHPCAPQTTMRSELGKISLDSVFSERDTLNQNIVVCAGSCLRALVLLVLQQAQCALGTWRVWCQSIVFVRACNVVCATSAAHWLLLLPSAGLHPERRHELGAGGAEVGMREEAGLENSFEQCTQALPPQNTPTHTPLCIFRRLHHTSVNDTCTHTSPAHPRRCRYEIRDIMPPSAVRNAMELQAEAERRKRASVGYVAAGGREGKGGGGPHISGHAGSKNAKCTSSNTNACFLSNPPIPYNSVVHKWHTQGSLSGLRLALSLSLLSCCRSWSPRASASPRSTWQKLARARSSWRQREPGKTPSTVQRVRPRCLFIDVY